MKRILYFTATWCGPCSYVKPQLQEASNQISISFVDVDSSKDTVAKYNVKKNSVEQILSQLIQKNLIL
jgi:thiol-disulfide isomerase/thioredoxin